MIDTWGLPSVFDNHKNPDDLNWLFSLMREGRDPQRKEIKNIVGKNSVTNIEKVKFSK